MKKSIRPQWSLVILTLFVSLTGALVRWQQIQNELLSDGGLAPGSFLHYILLGLSALLFGGLLLLLRPLPKIKTAARVFSSNFLFNGLLLVCAAGLALGNALLWVNGPQATTFLATQSPEVSGFLSSALPPLGLLAGGCLVAFAVSCALMKKPPRLLCMLICLYLVLRLIVCFQEWNTDPSVYDYGFQLLAAICSMLAYFELAGFSFDKGRLKPALFWCLCAAAFCSVSIGDTLIKGTFHSFLINLSLLLSMLVFGLRLIRAGAEN